MFVEFAFTQLQIIIKADDLRFDKENIVDPRWQEFADMAVKENIKVSPGVVGISLENGNSKYYNWIKKYNETGLFEFWNHGQFHKRSEKDGKRISEFYNRTVEEQSGFLKQTQDLARNNLGFDFQCFGSPYNWCDENTAAALQNFPEIKVWLYPPAFVDSGFVLVPRIPALNIEYPVHNANFYHFFNNYYFYSNNEVIAIQGHPLSWNAHRMEQFFLITEYLKDIEVEIIHPRDLLN